LFKIQGIELRKYQTQRSATEKRRRPKEMQMLAVFVRPFLPQSGVALAVVIPTPNPNPMPDTNRREKEDIEDEEKKGKRRTACNPATNQWSR
jgi:hypothetical protein